MASLIGYYSLVFGLCASLLIVFFCIKNFQNSLIFDNKVLTFTFLQLFFVIISFLGLIISFINSDFSNETVFNHSHTTKPLFYKISGTWGNHEGSMLLWLCILSIFSFFFSFTKNIEDNFQKLTLIIQAFLHTLFGLFIVFTSNPFLVNSILVNEGLGLNPILQDPGLAVHPPILYAGYVLSLIHI